MKFGTSLAVKVTAVASARHKGNKPMYQYIHDLVTLSEESGKPISEIAMETEVQGSGLEQGQLLENMKKSYRVMKQSVERGLHNQELSFSKLSGGDAVKLFETENPLLKTSPFIQKILANALAVSEQNAKMGIIVACPTAGSCGILPAVFCALQEEFGLSDEQMVKGLFHAGAIGAVVAEHASIAGAYGGCQAECGTATAMAASSVVEIMGGSASMSAAAVALSFKSLMGLVCDPVGGLVEVPCVKRNAFCAVNAFVAASMALSGVKSKIPADEVIFAMDEVGKMMNPNLKETAKGGIAVSKTAKEWMHRE